MASLFMKNNINVAQMLPSKRRAWTRATAPMQVTFYYNLTVKGKEVQKYTGGDKVKIWIWANYGVNVANTKLPTFVCCIALECIYRVHRECLFQTPIRNYMVFHLNSAGVITCVFYKLKARMEGVGTGAGSSCLKLSKIGSLWDARECESRGRLQHFQSSSGCL